MTADSGPRLIVQQAFHGRAHERAKAWTAPGGIITVGRGGDLETTADEARFQLAWDGQHCRLDFAADGPPIHIQGRLAVSGERVEHGAWLRAGSTDWLVHVEDISSSGTGHETTPELDAVCARLHGSIGSLYAVLNVPCLPDANLLLYETVERCGTLLSGAQADQMMDTAPQLVRFEPQSGLLRRLVVRGWRTRWGVFVRSASPMSELRTCLREALFVRPPGGEQTWLFRFYDPMVLGQYAEARRRRACQGLFSGLSLLWIDGGGHLLELTEDPS